MAAAGITPRRRAPFRQTLLVALELEAGAEAASATSTCSGDGSAVATRLELWPGRDNALATGCSGVAHHPAEDLGRGGHRPAAARLAGLRTDSGALPARVAPAAVASSRGPTRCVPQRSCSFAARSPCSYCRWRRVRRRGRRRGRARKREQRRCQRQCSGRQLLQCRRQAGRADGSAADSRGRQRRENRWALEREARLVEVPAHPRQHEQRLEQPGRASHHRTVPRQQPLATARHLDLAAFSPYRSRPRRRPVDEHAVRERHASQAQLLRPWASG